MSRKVTERELASNKKMRGKRLPVICLVLALVLQVSAAAMRSSMLHRDCGGLMAVTDAITAMTCCDDQAPDRRIVTGPSGCAESGSVITGTQAAATPLCSACAGDCAGASSPVVLPEVKAAPRITASFVPLQLEVSLRLSQVSHRLERPPRAALS
jgi:hypothetical protein